MVLVGSAYNGTEAACSDNVYVDYSTGSDTSYVCVEEVSSDDGLVWPAYVTHQKINSSTASISVSKMMRSHQRARCRDAESQWWIPCTDTSTSWSVSGSETSTCSYNMGQFSDWCDVKLYKGKFVKKLTPQDRLREIIKGRHAPVVIAGQQRAAIQPTMDQREAAARQTLSRVLGRDSFRQYLRNGFVTIRATSGRIYQIFPGDRMTRVYDQGAHVETLCVVLNGQFPPTDSLIMRYLLILNDEQDFRKRANVSSGAGRRNIMAFPAPEQQSLPEIFKALKSG